MGYRHLKPEQGEVVKALVEGNAVFAALPMRQEPLLRPCTIICQLDYYVPIGATVQPEPLTMV